VKQLNGKLFGTISSLRLLGSIPSDVCESKLDSSVVHPVA
jgi:hypothetical protein